MNQLTEILTPEFIERCKNINLDPKVVANHYLRVQQALKNNKDLSIPVVDTCRFDNGGLLGVKSDAIDQNQPGGIVSFVPAAGASSRYYKPFSKLLIALENDSPDDVNEQIEYLKSIGADQWPLPAAVKTLFSGNSPDFRAAAAALQLPKGLLPCVVEGDSFFDVKLAEDASLPFLEGTVFVIAPEHRHRFEAALPARYEGRVAFAEQGPSLSTIRINEDCEPYLEEDGSFSRVPAGHGMLAGLIPAAKQKFAGAHSVLIRNVDNVIGTDPAVVEAATQAANTHNMILSVIDEIRSHIAENQKQEAERAAVRLAERLSITLEGDPLWDLQKKLFHTNDTIVRTLQQNRPGEDALALLYQRPVNTMGVVPNTTNDVGGTPVFASLDNIEIKLCLEVPHASAEDRERFLANPEKATHFNPVFAFAEANFAAEYYQESPLSCWLLAKKTYKDRTVFYHETVLYELLGNNLLANVTFIEIPRLLFNPHKQPKDAAGRHVSDWVTSS